jgi:hypothetical protein
LNIKLFISILFCLQWYTVAAQSTDTLTYLLTTPLLDSTSDEQTLKTKLYGYCDSILHNEAISSFLLPHAGPKSETLKIFWHKQRLKDTATLRNEISTFFTQQNTTFQEQYFGLLTKQLPDFELNSFNAEHAYSAAYRNKILLLAVHPVPVPHTFDSLYIVLDSIRQTFATEPINFLFLSASFLDEIEDQMKHKEAFCSIIPHATTFCSKHFLSRATEPYFILADAKGIIQHIVSLPISDTYDFSNDEQSLFLYPLLSLKQNPYQDILKKLKEKIEIIQRSK